MKTVGEFLAHAIALEEESAVRFDELADALEVHHNNDVTELFRKMAHYSRLHLAEAKEMTLGVDVPHIKPWDFEWPDEEAPETPEMEGTHYMMPPYHALALALESERRGQSFYQGLADNHENDKLREMAKEFAEEEGEHVKLLSEMITRYPPPKEGWDEDMDPPNVAD
ncbi:MAG: ferritin family protein [Rhodospirillum sp.]|nr:ferritin family protein [Rhodospirillum sp.]